MDVYKCSACQTTGNAGIQKVILSPRSLQAGTNALDKPTINPSAMTGGFRPLLSIPERH